MAEPAGEVRLRRIASSTRTIQTIRQELAGVRIEARNAREDLAVTRARAELRAIERAGGEKAIGANAEARERALLVALRADDEYTACLGAVRDLEQRAENLEAALENARDERRDREWEIRLRLAAALDGRGVQSDGEDQDLADDTAFDDSTDQAVLREAEEAAQAAAELQPEDPGFWPRNDEPDALDRAIAEGEAYEAELAAQPAGASFQVPPEAVELAGQWTSQTDDEEPSEPDSIPF